MKSSWIVLATVFLLGLFSSVSQAQVTGTVDLVSVGWLSLPVSELSVLLRQHNYPGVSDHFLSVGLRTTLGLKDFGLHAGLAGQLAFALPSGRSDSSSAYFLFLYGGMLAEFTRRDPVLGRISIGSLVGIGGAFLELAQRQQQLGPEGFDSVLGKLVGIRATAELVRGYWVLQPYLSFAMPIPIEKLEIKPPAGRSFRGRPINPELTFTVGYVYAIPFSGWSLNDGSGTSWPGPLDSLSGPFVSVAFRMDIASLARPHVVIDSIRYRGEDEIVTLVNAGQREVDLSGWQLLSSTEEREQIAQVFVFPQGCVLPAGGRVRVHSGPAAQGKINTACGQAQIDLYGRYAGVDSDGAAVWDDRADVAWLRDAYGEQIDTCSYKAKPELDATECTP